MQAVRQLDQDHADVLRHGEEHLSEVLRLDVQLVVGPGDLGQLRDAVHQKSHVRAEHTAYLPLGKNGIFHHIVKQSRDDRLLVQLQLRQDNGDTQGMDDVGFAGFSALIHVGILRCHVCPLDQTDIVRGMIAPYRFDQTVVEKIRVRKVLRFFQ